MKVTNIFSNKLKKSLKKARGFSSIKAKTSRLSRRQKKELESNFDSLIKKLNSSKKTKLNNTISKIQGITRGNLTRKHLPKIKEKLLKEKERKFKELIGPKYFKQLQELPINILVKILDNIFEKYDLHDDEAKNLLFISIFSSNIINSFNNSLDNIYELNKTVLKYCKELVNNLTLINSYSIYPSSADEDEREMINDEFRDVIADKREKMRMISIDFNKLLIFRDNMLNELKKIFKIINLSNNDKIIIENFSKQINIDCYEELDKVGSGSTYKLDLKIEDLKKLLPKLIQNVKNTFNKLLQNKLIFTKDEITRTYDIVGPIYDSITSIDYTFSKFGEFIESKVKQKMKSKSKSKR